MPGFSEISLRRHRKEGNGLLWDQRRRSGQVTQHLPPSILSRLYSAYGVRDCEPYTLPQIPYQGLPVSRENTTDVTGPSDRQQRDCGFKGQRWPDTEHCVTVVFSTGDCPLLCWLLPKPFQSPRSVCQRGSHIQVWGSGVTLASEAQS